MSHVARAIPDDRLERLVRAASDVFIERGFRHTQMADVADALGVAKGTLYLYVESKEALFDLVCRQADRPFEKPERLPVPTPKPRATLRLIAERLAGAMTSLPPMDASADLRAVVEGLYDTLAAHRVGLKLIDRSARDLPELAGLWFGAGRGTVVAGLARALQAGIRAGRLRSVEDADVAARTIVETCAFWAVHRHWDAGPQPVDDALARRAVVELFVAAFARVPPQKKGSRT